MKNSRVATSTASALAVFSLVVGAAATAAAEEPVHSLDQESLIPALAEAQESQDKEPLGSAIVSDANIDPGSVRALGADELGRYWSGIDKNGYVCLIAHVANFEVSGLSGAACVPPLEFYKHGAAMRLKGAGSVGLVAHMLPPDATASDGVVDAVHRQGGVIHGERTTPEESTQLIVRPTAGADTADAMEIGRDSGEGLVLYPMNPRP